MKSWLISATVILLDVVESTVSVKNLIDVSDRGRLALLQIGLRPSALIASNQRVRFEDICVVSAENLTPIPLTSMSLSNFDIGELTRVQTSFSSAGIEKASSGVRNKDGSES